MAAGRPYWKGYLKLSHGAPVEFTEVACGEQSNRKHAKSGDGGVEVASDPRVGQHH